ncbi:MAG: carboxypeptidase-like regulatory domain-containing protein [Flavobacteriaceae bacterium]|nr:carboxypeptidase-like regulatory domain-containing protein [Flavobacteriaceae bacterium]
MKKVLFLMVLIGTIGYAQDRSKTISGTVNDGRVALSNVSVTVESTGDETTTDDKGRYMVSAKPGDVIRYGYQGMKPVRILVEDVTRYLNISLAPDVQELEEVVIVGSSRKSQKDMELEYRVNPNIIRTAYGYIDADRAPGNIRFRSESEINAVGICILDVLKNEFPGVIVYGDCLSARGPSLREATAFSRISGRDQNVDFSSQIPTSVTEVDRDGSVFIRGTHSINNPRAAIFDVDGVIFTQPPIWLDIKNIKRIAVLNNFATVTQYGNIGTGGVIVINTYTGTAVSNKITDFAKLRNNYATPALSEEQIRANWPTYLKELHKSTSGEDAKLTFDEYYLKYRRSPHFILDTYGYFYNQRNNVAFADEIIEQNFGLFEGNPVLLKALAYNYESQGRHAKANEVYKTIYTLRPQYGQSYMDLANSYRDLRNYKQAAAIYNRYAYMKDTEILRKDSTAFDPIINREYNNLLSLFKNEVVSGEGADDLFVVDEDFAGTRFVFEWNDGDAEFELQFVNPGNQHFTWKHTLASNDELLMTEKENGFSSSEYLMDGSLPGTWKVNAKYHGNMSLSPTYLKATIYHNYGSVSQRKEVKVFKLHMQDINQELFSISNGSSVVLR